MIFECARCNELTYSASRTDSVCCRRCGMERHRAVEGDFAHARAAARDLDGCDHAVLAYSDPGLIAPFCARYLTEGLDRGERVMARVPNDLREAIDRLLAPDVQVLVEWEDPHSLYGDFDAERVAAHYDALFAAEPRRVRVLAGVDRSLAEGVDPAELDRYEGMAHRLITRREATAICLYDLRELPEEYLVGARRRHTLVVVDGAVRRNEAFEYAPA